MELKRDGSEAEVPLEDFRQAGQDSRLFLIGEEGKMPSLSGYKTELDYSYAPGIFPSMECLKYRPERVRRLLVHSSFAGREGAEKLTRMAEEIGVRVETADRMLSRISGKENCYAAAVFEKFSDVLRPELPHVLLHQPGDSGNVGTILRTALGLGTEDVALV